MAKLLSIKAISNGRIGQPFMIGCIIYDTETKKIERTLFRCPIEEEEIDTWTKQEVLTSIKEIKETHASLESILFSFGEWYKENSKEALVLWNKGHIEEAGLFTILVKQGLLSPWEIPYEAFDINVALRMLNWGGNHDLTFYLKENQVELPQEIVGGDKNPLYMAEECLKVFLHLKGEKL